MNDPDSNIAPRVNRPNDRTGHDKQLTLLIDADDTLWENNIYFLEVTEHFLEAVERAGVPRELARQELSNTERRNVPLRGYGSRAFAESVAEAFRSLAPHLGEEILETLSARANGIYEREKLELLPGVEDTLTRLGAFCRLILVTKGDREEQARKVSRSGLAPFFERVEIVREKDAEMYRSMIRRLNLDPTRTWMIGNSPRSDINPALEAGLNAVLVPHPHTWELEVEEVGSYQERLVIVDSFGEVLALFLPDDESEAV